MISVKRLFDITLSIFALLILFIPMLGIGLLVRLTSPGPALHWSERVGKNNIIFNMPKFRSMHLYSPNLASHLIKDPGLLLTPIGPFLRKSSIDELPQLWSILIGDMSFVGPRPALYNQTDLVSLRTHHGVHILVPGLTGLAQVSGRDELSLTEKVVMDTEYLNKKNFILDLKILRITLLKVINKDGILH